MAVFVCRRCEYEQDTPWLEECPSCKGFYRSKKVGVDKSAKRITGADAEGVQVTRIPTGVDHLDDVLSGGIVKEYVILFGGPKGSGKTTLMIQALDSFSRKHDCPVLFASKEEYSKFVLATFNRVGVVNPRIEVMGAGEVDDVRGVLDRCKESGAKLGVFDSLQRLGFDDMAASSQRDVAVAGAINAYCKKSGMCAVVMSHMTKGLEMVGSTQVGHDLDVELEIHMFNEKDDGRASKNFTDEDLDRILLKDVRTLLVGKNRGGEMGRKVFWLSTATGLGPLAQRPPKKPAELAPKTTTLKLVTEDGPPLPAGS